MEPLTLDGAEADHRKGKAGLHPAHPGRPDGPEPGHGAGPGAAFWSRHGVRAAGRQARDHRQGRGPAALQGHHGEASASRCIPSKVVDSLSTTRWRLPSEIGYPVIVRPAFTLGGTGGGICRRPRRSCARSPPTACAFPPSHQVLIEKCISGWKEIEFEVMRDGKGNVITVCNMENFDPVGVHTGDSIVVAPGRDPVRQGIPDAAHRGAEHHLRRWASRAAATASLPCNPDSFEYAVIEVNPRVSRSSALASKATGYPIAKVAAKIAIGYTPGRDRQRGHRQDLRLLRAGAGLLRGQVPQMAL